MWRLFLNPLIMSFNLQNYNINPIGGLITGGGSIPGPIATAPRANTGLTGSVNGVLTGATSTQAIGTLGTGSTGSTNSGSNSNTGTIGSGVPRLSQEQIREVLQAQSTTTTPVTDTNFWEKYKVWIIPAGALVIIGVALYFYLKK